MLKLIEIFAWANVNRRQIMKKLYIKTNFLIHCNMKKKKRIKELNEIILFDMGYFYKSDGLNL